jgi:deoxyribonuclease V
MSDDLLIACVDVDYRPDSAVAAGIWFRGWTADTPEHQAVAFSGDIAEYEPGAFYRRELPCLLGVLAKGPRADVVIVDGYVWLADKSPGLGAHLHAALGGIVVGIAKSKYVSATDALPVLRGTSRVPLFVSAVGMPVADAAKCVVSMHGNFRVPTLVKHVDSLARTASHPSGPSCPIHDP